VRVDRCSACRHRCHDPAPSRVACPVPCRSPTTA
jgi:hypothetical protein